LIGIYKRERCGDFTKSVRPPSCVSPFKIPRHLVQLLAISILIVNSVHSSGSGFFYYTLQLLATAQRTNLETVANGAMNFLNTYCTCFFSVAKGAIMLRNVGNCVMMPVCRLHIDCMRDENSANAPCFSYPYGAMNFKAVIAHYEVHVADFLNGSHRMVDGVIYLKLPRLTL
jgi:hypothetical protein